MDPRIAALRQQYESGEITDAAFSAQLDMLLPTLPSQPTWWQRLKQRMADAFATESQEALEHLYDDRLAELAGLLQELHGYPVPPFDRSLNTIIGCNPDWKAWTQELEAKILTTRHMIETRYDEWEMK